MSHGAGVGRQITREIKLHPLIAPYWLVEGSRGETVHNNLGIVRLPVQLWIASATPRAHLKRPVSRASALPRCRACQQLNHDASTFVPLRGGLITTEGITPHAHALTAPSRPPTTHPPFASLWPREIGSKPWLGWISHRPDFPTNWSTFSPEGNSRNTSMAFAQTS